MRGEGLEICFWNMFFILGGIFGAGCGVFCWGARGGVYGYVFLGFLWERFVREDAFGWGWAWAWRLFLRIAST